MKSQLYSVHCYNNMRQDISNNGVNDLPRVPPRVQVIVGFTDNTITVLPIRIQDPQEIPSLLLLLNFF